MKLTHAIILAAGLGTRMRPLTETLPKPLIAVKGKPLIDWCIDWLSDGGIDDIVVNTSYRAVQLETYLSQKNTPPHLCFSREEPLPLETGGGIAKALPLLGNQPFLAMNSDAIFPAVSPHPIHLMAQYWDDSLDFLMLLVPCVNAIGWQGNGDFILDENSRIRRPETGEDAAYVFSGVEMIHPRVFDGCPPGAFSLSQLWKKSQGEDGWYCRIRGVIHPGPWLNVGDLAGLALAQDYGGGALSGSRI